MRKNFSDVAFYPQPVLVIGTYDENGTPNAMNVGWGGMCGSKYVNINISRRHKQCGSGGLRRPYQYQGRLRYQRCDLEHQGAFAG